MIQNFIKNIINCKEIIEWKNSFDKLNKNPEKKEFSNDLRKKEYNLWKLIIIQFFNWNKQNYQENKQKIINLNKFEEFKKEVKKAINNFKLEQELDELTKKNLTILLDVIKTLCGDIKRNQNFLNQENITFIAYDNINENDLENFKKSQNDQYQDISFICELEKLQRENKILIEQIVKIKQEYQLEMQQNQIEFKNKYCEKLNELTKITGIRVENLEQENNELLKNYKKTNKNKYEDKLKKQEIKLSNLKEFKENLEQELLFIEHFLLEASNETKNGFSYYSINTHNINHIDEINELEKLQRENKILIKQIVKIKQDYQLEMQQKQLEFENKYCEKLNELAIIIEIKVKALEQENTELLKNKFNFKDLEQKKYQEDEDVFSNTRLEYKVETADFDFF